MRTEPLMDFIYKEESDGMMYPEIRISDNPQTDRIPVGLFGKQWKAYMTEKYPDRLSELVARGRINEVILQVDREAEERKERIIQELLAARPMPDTMDTMERAGHMNMITKTAEEIVMDEIVLKNR